MLTTAIINRAKQDETIEQGAAATVWADVWSLINGNLSLYLENANMSRRKMDFVNKQPPLGVDPPRFDAVEDYAIHAVPADKLWVLSGTVTGVTFLISIGLDQTCVRKGCDGDPPMN
jgi:hypothetical protein